MRATVLGAGVVGLCVAVELIERGASVTLVERSPGLGGNASWLAGGMLAPDCEADSAPEEVVRLGEAALPWWEARVPDVKRTGTLVLAPARDLAELDRFAARTRNFERLDEAGVAALEPDLAGRFRHGLFYSREGHVDPREAMAALCNRLARAGATMRFGAGEAAAGAGEVVIDCRGFFARPDLPDLRGVRGEMLHLRTRDITLRRNVRLLHPRVPVYIAPRAEGAFMIGATMIECAENGGVSVRSAIELLNAAYALHPAFGEAEILELSADVRPAYPDNAPRIEERKGRIFVNGFYRHGFLLAPAYAARAAALAFERAGERQCA